MKEKESDEATGNFIAALERQEAKDAKAKEKELNDAQREEKRKRIQVRKAREERLKNIKSKCQGCSKFWVSAGGDWTECEVCSAFSFCSDCYKQKKYRNELDKHEAACTDYIEMDDSGI